MSASSAKLKLKMLNISYAAYAPVIRKKLEKHDGIIQVRVNQIPNAMYVDYQPQKISEEEIEEVVNNPSHKVVKLHGMA